MGGGIELLTGKGSRWDRPLTVLTGNELRWWCLPTWLTGELRDGGWGLAWLPVRVNDEVKNWGIASKELEC
jgi:hypothetical protein